MSDDEIQVVETVKSEGSPKKKKKKTPTKAKPEPLQDAYDVVFPSTTNIRGECTVLVQIDPQDASTLALDGAVGAVGRLETDEDGVLLDLKGCQYRGTLYPGPTAMVLSLVNRKGDIPHIKVDGITDEFCRLVKTGDAMDKLHAVVKGDMDDYRIVDDDVNRVVKESVAKTSAAAKAAAPTTQQKHKKRKGGASASTAGPTKKRKSGKGVK